MGGHLTVFTKPLILFSVAVFVALSFQNCSSEAPFGVRDSFSLLTESSRAEDFPYEASFDQVAYMSCSEQEDVFNDFQTFFTFRFGAYRNAGLRITDQFLENTHRMSNRDRANILMQHQLSQGSRLQFALRAGENYQLAFINEDSPNDGSDGVDYSNVFTSIGDEVLSSYVVNQPLGQWMNYFPAALLEKDYRFEGSVYFNSSETLQNEMRSFLSNRGILALTFSTEATINPRGPGSAAEFTNDGTVDPRTLARDVFGAGARVTFKQPSPVNHIKDNNGNAITTRATQNMPPRLLASVEDFAIDGRYRNQPRKVWNCGSEMAFMIVLPEHATYTVTQNGVTTTRTRCRMDPDPLVPDERLKMIRNSLYAEDWFVDLNNRCVVPKPDRVNAGSCYGKDSNNLNTVAINYDFSQPCGFTTGNVCPHFVSICTREP